MSCNLGVPGCQFEHVVPPVSSGRIVQIDVGDQEPLPLPPLLVALGEWLRGLPKGAVIHPRARSGFWAFSADGQQMLGSFDEERYSTRRGADGLT